MNISVKYDSETKVKLTIDLGLDELTLAETRALKSLAKEVKVAGFRKGKAPAAEIKKAVDQRLLQDKTIDFAVNQAMAEAFTSKDLRPIDRPAVAISKFVPGEAMELIVTCDVLPPVKLGDYRSLKISKPNFEVAEAEVDEIMERIGRSFATKIAVKRNAQSGDGVIIDFVGKKNGVKFAGGEAKDFPLTLGSNQFIPGFEDSIVGHKAGDKFNIDLKFPDNYQQADLAGQAVSFEVELKTVNSIKLPEMNDKLANKVGPFKKIEDLKTDIKKELLTQKQRQADELDKQNLVNQLVEKTKISLPDILVQDQIRQIRSDFENDLKYRQLSLEQYLKDKNFKSEEDWLEKEVKPAAENRVKAGIVLAELVKVEAIAVSDDEVEARLQLFRQQYSKNPDIIKQLDLPASRQDITSSLLNEKALNRLVELNKK